MELKAQVRSDLGKKSEILREQGLIPAVIYGPDKKNENLTVNEKEFNKVFEVVGTNRFIDLIVGNNEPIMVLVKECQKDSVTDKIIHIDFYQIKKGHEITVDVELNYHGVSMAVKQKGGTLVKNFEKVTVKCLPKNIIENIDIDLSKLAEYNDSIYIKDLEVPEEVSIQNPQDQLVVTVLAPRKEKEIQADTVSSAPVEQAAKEGDSKEGEVKEGEAGKEENKEEDKSE